MMPENPDFCSETFRLARIGASTVKPSRKYLRLWWLGATTAVVAAAWLFDAIALPRASSGLLFDNLEAIPRNRVGLLLGCVPRLADGRTNQYFTLRVQAAARLFHADKVAYLLVSGDARRDGQDEPAAMRDALLALQVPDERIVLDVHGLRTLDSIARAKQVFGLEQLTVISQRFHNERAIYIARAFGLAVVGYNASDPPHLVDDKMRMREPFARLIAVLDTRVLKTKPRTLGERVTIGQAP
jgi:SanA protein